MSYSSSDTEIIGVNGSYISTSTVIRYIPLVGSQTDEAESEDTDVIFSGNSKIGRVLSFNFLTDSSMGVTVFTINLAGNVIGTVTRTVLANTLFCIDFTTMLDSGTNETDEDWVSIGINPTTAGNNNSFSAVFETRLI